MAKKEIYTELWQGKPLVGPSKGRPRKRSEENSKLDLREIDCEDMNWIKIVQCNIQWWSFRIVV
jgi:hypothetical protein